ncbi:hypothetical protein GALMADRAFT_205265 [Galerina marginata CBS 339.88]|uniref:Uncharacterized protein n=1 Tax=Galerina marginata (strain CBS 339.88) TaxID=685588 RepID=A0A067TSA5_GALM3|nr:hypothetical protein GALMADRAFT_205265 [Galerina marginata CBS 339.88]
MDASQMQSNGGFFTSESDLSTLPICSSNQIRSAAKQPKDGSMNIDSKGHLWACHGKADGELLHAHAQSVVTAGIQLAVIQQAQEEYYLRTEVESRPNLSAQAAFDIARLARNTLTSEADLARTRVKESEILLANLKDASKEASFYAAEADRQVHHLLNHLDPDKLSSTSIDYDYPVYSPLPADSIAIFKNHVRTFLLTDRPVGNDGRSSLSGTSGHNPGVTPENLVISQTDSGSTPNSQSSVDQ